MVKMKNISLVLNNKLDMIRIERSSDIERIDKSIDLRLRLIRKGSASEISEFRKSIKQKRREKERIEAQYNAEIDLLTKRLLFVVLNKEANAKKKGQSNPK
jgi:hypothetical protein